MLLSEYALGLFGGLSLTMMLAQSPRGNAISASRLSGSRTHNSTMNIFVDTTMSSLALRPLLNWCAALFLVLYLLTKGQCWKPAAVAHPGDRGRHGNKVQDDRDFRRVNSPDGRCRWAPGGAHGHRDRRLFDAPFRGARGTKHEFSFCNFPDPCLIAAAGRASAHDAYLPRASPHQRGARPRCL